MCIFLQFLPLPGQQKLRQTNLIHFAGQIPLGLRQGGRTSPGYLGWPIEVTGAVVLAFSALNKA
jgi:hypothetical protein